MDLDVAMEYLTLANLSSWAAFVTALAALFAILEMRRQRTSGYKPELLLLSQSFSFHETTSGPYPVEVTAATETAGDLASSAHEVRLECLNVGTGPAIDVVAEWHVDVPALIAKVTPTLANRGVSAWFDSGNGVLSFELEGRMIEAHSTTAQMRCSYPFILPVQGRSSPTIIPLPAAYVKLVALLASAEVTRDGPLSPLPDLPNLQLNLSYKDLGGKRFKDRTCVEASLAELSFMREGEGGGRLLDGVVSLSVRSGS